MRTFVKVLAVIVVIIIVAGGFAYWWVTQEGAPSSNNSSGGIYATYIASNPALTNATALEGQGQYQAARETIEGVLAQTSAASTQGTIAWWAASNQQLSGDYIDDLGSFESVAANTAYDPQIRTAAVQQQRVIYNTLP